MLEKQAILQSMIQSENIKSKFFVLVTIIFIFVGQYGAVAANNAMLLKEPEEPTLFELAIFAFFRIQGMAPDYEHWITGRKYYDSVPEELKEEYLLQKSIELGNQFSNYNMEEDLLVIETEVVAELKAPNADEDQAAVFSFRFPEDDRTKPFNPVFAFSYGPDVIALKVRELEFYSNMKLSQTQFERMAKKLPYPTDQEFPAVLHLRVKPYSADTKKPAMNPDETKQYIMNGKIGFIRCIQKDYFTQKEVELWDYLSPWHKEIYERKIREAENPEEQYPHPYDLFKD